ncbi:MAG TPA: M23 family metallopeptidase [Candidatus Onthousia excrementipullorum]|uniref:M23 family metallopeptidase n=1 Tax=Candidatus Onthousia excrementipullorum TaxID=2840884 RepID=A0A9D1J3F9_9FIRM|nr:M23 family metallopeptidase [Candidatus Onthousia excrementipullorum]
MKKLRLKKGAIIGAYLIAFSLTGMSAFYVSQNMQANNPTEEDIEYVNSSIIDDDEKDREVIKEDVKMVKPYTDENVQVLKYFYDYQANADSQEKSILYHENTYIQNSGMDFGLENTFDVVSVLDGTVVDVREDELLGTVVEIKHDNDFISSYQSLSEVSVKKNDTVKQGQVIGKSGTNTIDQDLGNHLHFELYKSGEVVDPSKYFDQVISDTTEKSTSDNTTTEDTSDNSNTNEETE